MAIRRTAAMSMPNRVAAAPMKANCVASVTMPRASAPGAPPPKEREISTFAAKVARTKTPRPTTFWAVPARTVA